MGAPRIRPVRCEDRDCSLMRIFKVAAAMDINPSGHACSQLPGALFRVKVLQMSGVADFSPSCGRCRR